MASITIDLPDSQFQKLQDLARVHGIPAEALLRASIEDWLSSSKGDFTQVTDYVLNKNAELYRRLA
ncbi:DNA-binding protein [Gloeocapsopsis dulcis]|uniref:DNA-binding protein n=1 Tax=Gloeocapsopsis dulcis AAB1 = 1H9 TaxID=1433147 RepID=A0A6N8G515_9CHRO|nr:DNA-binding protein [Gloeocapsopsis dulcis]MUL39355.1 DNA-binding protein [Gloeocapsopsis dulcis AAB1 = 1H9]WNN89688.1 DNA-binding protein [Gloeocapsopsis dulcis]